MILALGAPARAPSMGLAALTVAVSALLAACGGGGDGTGGGGGLSAPSESSTPMSTPTTPTAQPAPVAPPDRTLAPGAELAPTLGAPQPGSTALTGDDKQGIYESFFGYTFVTSAGRLMSKDHLRWVFGSIDVNGLNWSFRPLTLSLEVIGSELNSVTGSGTFTPKKSMSGTYSVGGRTESRWGPYSYSASNALAVTQQAMAGKWSTTSTDGFGMSIELDDNGNLTGSTAGDKIGVCALSGSLLQTEPSTSRNMFNVKLKASNAATGMDKACVLEQIEDYNGLAGVLMVPVSSFPEEGAYRTLLFHAGTGTGALLTNNLRRR